MVLFRKFPIVEIWDIFLETWQKRFKSTVSNLLDYQVFTQTGHTGFIFFQFQSWLKNFLDELIRDEKYSNSREYHNIMRSTQNLMDAARYLSPQLKLLNFFVIPLEELVLNSPKIAS